MAAVKVETSVQQWDREQADWLAHLSADPSVVGKVIHLVDHSALLLAGYSAEQMADHSVVRMDKVKAVMSANRKADWTVDLMEKRLAEPKVDHLAATKVDQKAVR